MVVRIAVAIDDRDYNTVLFHVKDNTRRTTMGHDDDIQDPAEPKRVEVAIETTPEKPAEPPVETTETVTETVTEKPVD